MQTYTAPEPLEQRIAPAVVIAPNGLSASFPDADGDRVTITVSKGHLDATDFTVKSVGFGNVLEHLDFSNDGGEFDGADISIVAEPQGGVGNGFVNIGWIDSTGHGLGKVTVDGDLAKLTAGSGSGVGLGKLRAHSMGLLGKATGAPDLITKVLGDVGTIRVDGDVVDANWDLSGHAGRLVIGGSVVGHKGSSGHLFVTGDVDKWIVGGSVIGGEDSFTGTLGVDGNIKLLDIKGSIIGGASDGAGGVYAIHADSAHIGGAILGGAGAGSGQVNASFNSFALDGGIGGGSGLGSGRLQVNSGSPNVVIKGGIEGDAGEQSGTVKWLAQHGSLRIVGGIHGGSGELSGAVFEKTPIGSETNTMSKLVIIGDVRGGSAKDSGSVHAGTIVRAAITGDVAGSDGAGSGAISIVKNVQTIGIGGDVNGGTGADSGKVFAKATAFGALKVGGSIVGGAGGNSGSISIDSLAGVAPANITIAGDIRGDAGVGSGALNYSGSLKKIDIGGSLVGGAGNSSGLFAGSGAEFSEKSA